MSYKELTIVGVGASAGGFEAFQKFLPKLVVSQKTSYVIVQHLDPRQPTLFGELLSKYTSYNIIAIQNEEIIQAGKIYYCPPNKDVTVRDGILYLSIPESKSYPKPSINKFFSSLAIEKKEKAISIILSGTGSDGAKGVIEITKYGGIALTEDGSAKYYSMPKASIDTGKVIASLPAEILAECIEQVIDDKDYFKKHFSLQNSMEQIFSILNKKTGIDFSSYKQATIKRRIKKRMNETKLNNVNEYLKILDKDEKEVERLKNELLIIVTSFFRDKEAFLALKKGLYKVIETKLDNSLRIWIPASATGEEAYSIAILVSEILEELKTSKKVTIFATDISEGIILKSRNKSFTEEQIKDIHSSYKEKYFEFNKGLYKPKKVLKQMIIFSKHDLIKDPPFLNLDLISCRNLLIYFDLELQKRVLSIFYYALRYHSLLFLGKSETIGTLNSLFSVTSNKYKIYTKLNDMGEINIDTLTYINKSNILTNSNKHTSNKNNPTDIEYSINNAISEQYGNNGVVIDSKSNEILFYKGDCSDYIRHPQGIQTHNIYKLLLDYLKLDFRATVNEAKKIKSMPLAKKLELYLQQITKCM